MNKTEREEEDVDIVLRAVPVNIYKTDRASYPWPKKNRCLFCMVGQFRRRKGTTILVCGACKGEFHIPAWC